MKELMFSVFPSENFVDLGLYQFGYEQCEPAHSFGPAVRNHFLFPQVLDTVNLKERIVSRTGGKPLQDL